MMSSCLFKFIYCLFVCLFVTVLSLHDKILRFIDDIVHLFFMFSSPHIFVFTTDDIDVVSFLVLMSISAF